MTTSPPVGTVTRRRALSSAATVGLSLPLLSACGDDGSDPGSDPTAVDSSDPTSQPPTQSAEPTSEPTTEPTSESPSGAAGVIGAGDVPVGSGVILADDEVVVTQPSDGEIKVFSSICTHQGCPVSEVTDTINCVCHGSMFDLASGDPVGGPASAPLEAVDFTLDGDQVVLS